MLDPNEEGAQTLIDDIKVAILEEAEYGATITVDYKDPVIFGNANANNPEDRLSISITLSRDDWASIRNGDAELLGNGFEIKGKGR